MRKVFCVSALAVAIATCASANTLTFVNVTPKLDINMTLPQGTYTYQVGQINMTDSVGDTPVKTFCATPNTWLNTGGSGGTYGIGGGGGLGSLGYSNVNGLTFLINSYFNNTLGGGTVNQQAAAVQLVVWSMWNGGSQLTNTTNAAATASISSLFATYQGLVTAHSNYNGTLTVYTPNPLSSSQVLIAAGDSGTNGSQPVPEPFTMGLGLASAGLYVRKRVKAKKAA